MSADDHRERRVEAAEQAPAADPKTPADRYKGWHQGPDGKWKWDLPNNAIKIGIPTAPRLEERPVALAAYNDAGPTYLFTCC